MRVIFQLQGGVPEGEGGGGGWRAKDSGYSNTKTHAQAKPPDSYMASLPTADATTLT